MRPASTLARRPATAALVAIAIALALLAMRARCNGERSGDTDGRGGGERGGGASDAAASDATTHAVYGRPGCHPTLEGGTLAKVAPGALSLAVVRDRALLVSTADGHADRIVLDRMGTPAGPLERVSDALPAGPGVATFAAAVAWDGRLTTVTYAARRPTPSDCADGLLVAKSIEPGASRRELTHDCRASSLFVAAARASVGIAFFDRADGATRADGDPKAAPAIADVVVLSGAASLPLRVETIAGGATIANAATAAGATSVAAAYVVAHDGTRELHVVQLGKDGKTNAKVEVFEKENVGTVTLAYEGDVLHVVWSSFVHERNRFVLRWSKWLAGAAPAAAQSLGTGVLSAATPSLAIDHGRFLLAWTNGDENATTVKVGASANGIAAIAGLANVVSTPTVVARDPVVALDGDAMFIAWKELAEVHAASISCRE